MNYQFDCVGQLVLITNLLLAKLCKIMAHKESLRDGEIIVLVAGRKVNATYSVAFIS